MAPARSIGEHRTALDAPTVLSMGIDQALVPLTFAAILMRNGWRPTLLFARTVTVVARGRGAEFSQRAKVDVEETRHGQGQA